MVFHCYTLLLAKSLFLLEFLSGVFRYSFKLLYLVGHIYFKFNTASLTNFGNSCYSIYNENLNSKSIMPVKHAVVSNGF